MVGSAYLLIAPHNLALCWDLARKERSYSFRLPLYQDANTQAINNRASLKKFSEVKHKQRSYLGTDTGFSAMRAVRFES